MLYHPLVNAFLSCPNDGGTVVLLVAEIHRASAYLNTFLPSSLTLALPFSLDICRLQALTEFLYYVHLPRCVKRKKSLNSIRFQ